MLSFQAEAFVLLVASCAGGTIQEVAGIELNAWLSCEDFHDAAARRFLHPGSECQRPILAPQNEAMVIADRICLDLLDTLADSVSRREVQRRSFHVRKFPCRNQAIVNRQILICRQHEFMIENGPRTRTCEIP